METLTYIPINLPGALGVDRRKDQGDVDALACLRMNGMDVFPAEEGTRVAPRRWFRRYGQLGLFAQAAAEGAGAFAGTFKYAYVWTDGAGLQHWSWTLPSVSAATHTHIRVEGWPVTAGTVAIYRTVDGGSTLKLVVSGLSVAANAFYNDLIADGALGANMPAAPAQMDPLGNDLFNQSVLVDALIPFRFAAGQRYLFALARAAGSGVGARLHWNDRGVDEVFAQGNAATAGASYGPVDVALLYNLLWIAAGGTNLVYGHSGGLFSAVQPATPTATFVQAAGTLTAATGHQYVVMAEDVVTGIRSFPSIVHSTGPYTNKKHTITITSGTVGLRHHIYRTSDGGGIFQKLTEYTGVPFVDETPDGSLSTISLPFDVGAPGGAKVAFTHKGVLVIANKTPAAAPRPKLVRWMSVLYPVNFPADSIIGADYETQVDPDDGDEILAGESLGETAILLGRHKCWAMIGDPPGFRFPAIAGSEGLGCVAHRTLVKTPVGAWWLSPAGIVLMPVGGTPQVMSGGIRDVFAEPQRAANEDDDVDVTSEPAEIEFSYRQDDAVAETFHFRVQLATVADFSAIAFDYRTDTPSQRKYFKADNAAFPAGGRSMAPGSFARITLRPPSAVLGGPLADTTYFVRCAAGDGFEWSTWSSLANFSRAFDDPFPDQIDWSVAQWSFAVHYAPRQEVWFWIPTGGHEWCDTVWIANYEPLTRGGDVIWRSMNLPATCGCTVDDFAVGSQEAETLLLIASPDGLIFAYPYTRDGVDFDTRVDVDEGERVVSASRTVPVVGGADLVATGTAWPTARYGLKGTLVVARDATGETFTGIVTANTGTQLTVAWLNGRNPAGGTDASAFEIAIGGVDAYVETAWIHFAADQRHSAILRELVLHSATARGSIDLLVRWSRGVKRSGARTRRRAGVPIGKGFQPMAAGVNIGGHLHQVRYGSIEPAQLWEILELTAAVEPTGSEL